MFKLTHEYSRLALLILSITICFQSFSTFGASISGEESPIDTVELLNGRKIEKCEIRSVQFIEDDDSKGIDFMELISGDFIYNDDIKNTIFLQHERKNLEHHNLNGLKNNSLNAKKRTQARGGCSGGG